MTPADLYFDKRRRIHDSTDVPQDSSWVNMAINIIRDGELAEEEHQVTIRRIKTDINNMRRTIDSMTSTLERLSTHTPFAAVIKTIDQMKADNKNDTIGVKRVDDKMVEAVNKMSPN
jgi:hypothetical protein